MDIQEYPSNSYKNKEKEAERTRDKRSDRPRKEPTEDLVIREQSIGKKIFKTFIQEDLRDVLDTVVHDYIVPGIKESFRAMIDIALGGDGYISRGSSYGGGRKSYDKYYSSRERDRYRDRDDRRRDERYSSDGRIRLEDILYRTRGQAEDVRRDLLDDMEHYDSVSVAGFFDILIDNGYRINDRYRNYTDNDYGWFDLGPLRIEPVRGGYIMRLPKPVSIKETD